LGVLIQGCFLEAVLEGKVLRDDQWERIKPFVPGGRKGKRGPRSDGRLFIDAPVVDGPLGRALAGSSGALRPL
jgi:hypothetical protein